MDSSLNNEIAEEIEKGPEPPKKCGICGDPHFYRECKYVVISKKIPDKEVPTKAKLSLPDILEIKKLADETESVFTKCFLEAGTEFGPYIAKRNLTLHPSATFPIKLFTVNESDLSEYYLDTTDENECCWMMFVKPAGDVEEQNLISYQEGENIFFGAIRDIQQGEELKVWYSPYCAFKMQKNTLTFKDSSKLLIELDGNAKTDTDDLNVLVKKQQKIIPRVVWNCKFCYKLEKNVTDFAQHLLNHYMSNKKKICEFCQKRFRYLADFKKHLKLFHGQSTEVKTPILQSLDKKELAQTNKLSRKVPKKSDIGGPLLLQCSTDSLDNSNSLLPQSEVNLFDMENYDNHNLLFDNNHLQLNVDVLGSSTIRDMDDIYPENKSKEVEKKEFVCDICLKKFATLKSISAHLKLHIGSYFCTSCKKVFGRAESFKQHKCNQVYSLKCPKCERVFYQKKYLVKHIGVYHDKKYACQACHKSYFSSNALKSHNCKQTSKDMQILFKCSKCPKSFISQRGLKNHTNKRHLTASDNVVSTRYICSECSKTFSSKDIYNRHVMSIHTISNKYDCKICDKVFSRRDILKMHLLNIHGMGQTETCQCSICKKQFKSKKYLNIHLKFAHENTKYNCDLCSSTFKYPQNIIRHRKLVHNNARTIEKKFECPICKDRVKLKNSLQKHIKQKHPDRYKTQCLELSAKKDESKFIRYKCPICQHKVKLKSSLQRHISNKHPEDYKNVSAQLNGTVCFVDKNKKELKTFEEELEKYIDLQKTIENMDFNIDNENLLGGSETIDKLLKESSDQISIFFADSPKAATLGHDVVSTDKTSNNREVGLSMPDLCEIEQEKSGKAGQRCYKYV